MADSSPHPQHAPLPSAPSRRSFLALSDDASLSTRGQRLPSLIQHRIGSSISSPRRSSTRAADASSVQSTDLERGLSQQRSYETDAARQQPTRRISSDGRGLSMEPEELPDPPQPPADFSLAKPKSVNGDRLERKGSVLFNPQMRSQRLIGNSNPRYKW